MRRRRLGHGEGQKEGVVKGCKEGGHGREIRRRAGQGRAMGRSGAPPRILILTI